MLGISELSYALIWHLVLKSKKPDRSENCVGFSKVSRSNLAAAETHYIKVSASCQQQCCWQMLGLALTDVEGVLMNFCLLEHDISKADTNALDSFAKNLWAEYAAGRVSDDDAERITRAVEQRRSILRSNTRKSRNTPLFDALKRNKLPNRAERIQQRRKVAHCGALPSHIAAKFTTSQIATLSIVIAEIKLKGRCELYVGQIAAMAGCCGRMAQSAIAEAERQGLIKVERRPRLGRSNLSNIITIIDKSLIAWVNRGNAHKQLYWVKKTAGNNTSIQNTARIRHTQHIKTSNTVNQRSSFDETINKIGQKTGT